MMPFQKWFCVIVLIFIVGCKQTSGGGGSGTEEIAGSEDAPYMGHWLSDCVDLGGGDVNRIYTELDTDLKAKLAILTYTDPDCAGTYSLTDNMGNDVTEAQYAQDISEEIVEDIPENFFVLKVTDIVTLDVVYAIININDHEFFELTGFTTPYDTWTGWQGEADVFAFASNPSTYEPLTYLKFHFTESELP